MFLVLAKEIWETIKQTYFKIQDASIIFEIKTKNSSTRHGYFTVTEYYNNMNGLWLELDHYQDIKKVCSEHVTTLNQILERDKIVEFLAGLNTEFDHVRVQILGKERLPSLNEVFAIVRSEENQRITMLSESGSNGSTMVSNKGEGARLTTGKSEVQTKNSNREGLWCTYCKKPRHIALSFMGRKLL